MKHLSIEKRLIVALDAQASSKPPREPQEPQLTPQVVASHIRNKVLASAQMVASHPHVTVKVNTALRICGYGLIEELHTNLRVPVFADLKLYDTAATLGRDAEALAAHQPAFLTVSSQVSDAALQLLREVLPDTTILMVSVLTDSNAEQFELQFCTPLERTLYRSCERALATGIDGVVASPLEAQSLREKFGNDIIIATPSIRPDWWRCWEDDQKRTTTPIKAIRSGADYLIVGRPIIEAAHVGKTPEWAIGQILREIEHAISVSM